MDTSLSKIEDKVIAGRYNKKEKSIVRSNLEDLGRFCAQSFQLGRFHH